MKRQFVILKSFSEGLGRNDAFISYLICVHLAAYFAAGG